MLTRCLCLVVFALVSLPGTSILGQESTSPRIRILTYNIHHGQGADGRFDYGRLSKAIADLRPDLVALQEVDRRTDRSDGVDQAAHLAEALDMEYAFGRAMHYSGGEYGEAILSRFPITRVWNHPLPYRVGQEPRSAVAVQVTPPEGIPSFIFVGTHLCHQSGETRLEQTRQLNLIFASRSGPPVVLAGDLNARPNSAPMRELLDERWTDAVAPQSRIDYVLLRRHDSWKVHEVTIVRDDVTSDHRPVLVVLEWVPS